MGKVLLRDEKLEMWERAVVECLNLLYHKLGDVTLFVRYVGWI